MWVMPMEMKKINGTPWHIGYVTKKDERRDKRRCRFYVAKEDKCIHYAGKCFGSAHCKKYDTSERTISFRESNALSMPPASIKPGETIQHKQFGTGKVIKVEQNRVTVLFGTNEKILDWLFCIKNKLISV